MPHSSALSSEIAAKFVVCSAQKRGMLACIRQDELFVNCRKRRTRKGCKGRVYCFWTGQFQRSRNQSTMWLTKVVAYS